MNKIFVSKTNITPQSSLPYSIPLLYRPNHNFHIKPTYQNLSKPPKIRTLCSSTLPDPPSYGGWDDFQLGAQSASSGESTQFKKFLDSLGINDKKFILVYLLGFLCASAVTRIRVSSVIAISASVVLFASGFIIGHVNGGFLKLDGSEKRTKDEIFRGAIENLNCIVDILKGVDVEIEKLKDGVKRNIETDQVALADLEGIISSGESVNVLILNGKNIVEGLLESLLIENQEGEKYVTKKLNKRTNEGGENGFGLSRFVARLFGDKLVGLNPMRKKDSGKSEVKDGPGNHGASGNSLSPAVEERIWSTSSNRETANKTSIAQEKPYNMSRDGRRMGAGAKIGNMGMFEMYGVPEKTFDRNEYRNKNKSVRFIDNHRASLEMNKPNRYSNETLDTFDNDVSSIDFEVIDAKQTKTGLDFKQEKLHRNILRDSSNLDSIEKGETEIDKSSSLKEGPRQEDEVTQVVQDSAHNSSYESSPSIVSDDKEFSEYLEEANLLLREAKKVLAEHINDGNAEQELYKSAGLLSKAIELRPMSLLAIGQLGNTYLLHGELKLRISRKLRAILAGKDSFSMDIWGLGELGDKLDRNDKLMSALVDTCEECEHLLIKAGRNYRMALSIDGNDMRAMYNWGLALSFRGQLIADIGPGAARDADRVFLAAIDKFDAMLSKSNVHAPEALFRWGTTLQQRSRLRPRNSKEKLKFLQQARRLYEDALDMDSDNFQVQEALSTCISELNFWYK